MPASSFVLRRPESCALIFACALLAWSSLAAGADGPAKGSAAGTSPDAGGRRTVVAIFDGVPDWAVLAANAPDGADVMVLDSRREGLRELAEALDGSAPVDALHVISHGSPGALHLGTSRLTAGTSTAHASDLAALGARLAPGADLLFYGCEVARDAGGLTLLRQVAAATGADVAASSTLTGARDKGGDWTLEAIVGDVDHRTVLEVPAYADVLQALQPGDLVVLGWSALDNTIRLATLVDIPAGTTVYITDRGWDQATNTFTPTMTGDGELEWTTSAPISAGTVFSLTILGNSAGVALTNVTSATDLSADTATSGWTVADPVIVSGDGVLIYEDVAGTPRFLFGLNNSSGTVDASNWNTSIAATLRDSMLPNGVGSLNALTNGVNAIGLPGGASQQDNVQYIGPATAADRATWLARIANVTNWTGDDTGMVSGSIVTSLAMAAPNTAPAIGNLSGDSVSFTEGAAAVLLDANGNATVTDADSADFSGGNVTAAIVTNRLGTEDVLGVANVGTGPGQIGVSGASISYGGVTIGSAAGGTGSNDLVVSLNASATPAATEALVRALTYLNTNTVAPNTATRTVRVTVNDGDGGTSTNADVSVTITPVNDPPTLSATGATAFFTEGGAAADLFSSVAVSPVEAGQAMQGIVLTITNVTNGASEILSVDGTDVALVNGNAGVTSGNGLSYSVSVASSTASVSLFGVAVPPAVAQTVVDGMGYRNDSANPTTGIRVVTLTMVSDNGGTANGGVDTTVVAIAATVTVAAVNDAPVVTASGVPTSFTEGTSVMVDAGLSISDPDSSTLGWATVAVTGNFTIEDVLSFVNDGTTMGNIAGSYNQATGVLSLYSAGTTATLAQWQAALRSVTYHSSSESPSTATRTIAFAVSDGALWSSPATKSVAVTSMNDRPDISAPANLSITEDVATALTGMSFSDVDAGISPVTVSFEVSAGVLAAAPNAGVNVISNDQAAITLAGTIADINAFIAAGNVMYTPVANSTTSVTLTLHIDDGGHTGADPGTSGTSASEARTTLVTITVDAVNDAPVHTVPATQSTVIATNLVFSTADGNAIAVSDVDAGTGNVEVTLAASDGVLTLATTSGLSLQTGDGTADPTIVMVGTLAAVNAALDGLTFTPAPLFTGSVNLSITTNDLGNSGSGGAQQTTDAVTINVIPGPPRVTGLSSASANGTYKLGDTITIAVTFDNTVAVDPTDGTPFLLLETGAIDRMATYATGSCTDTLTFTYVVQAGDLSMDLDYASTIALVANGGRIRGDNDLEANLTLPEPGSGASLAGQAALVVDGVGPRVVSVAVPPNGTYGAGQQLLLTVVFDEPVTVNTTGGVPTLQITLDAGGPLHASYMSGSGSASLVFGGLVTAGQRDADGIAIGPLAASGATLRDALGNDADLVLSGIAPTSGVLVDTEAPGITIGAPSVTSTVQGPVSFTVTYTEASSVSLSNAHVTLTPTGSVSGVVSVSGSGATTREVTVSDISGAGSFTISVAAGTATDAAGNSAAAAGPSASVIVEERQLTAVSPTAGLADGGIAVRVSGVGFIGLIAPTVRFGGVAATRVKVISDTEMRAITPPLTAGSVVDVEVVSSGTPLLLDNAYTPLDAPTDPAHDTDNDTLPDAWELRFGLDPLSAADATDDPDNDGHSNLAEFAAGTHPHQAWHRAFAEGVVTDTFTTTLSVFNPNLERASVVVHYYVDGAPPVRDELEIAPGASLQHDLSMLPQVPRGAFAIGLESNVDLVTSSLTTWDADAYGAGAESAVEPAGTWYLAEGATHGPFDLFYLVANPNPFAVDLDVTFLRPSPASPLVRRYTVGARGRTTLWVDVLDPELASTDVSAIVRAVGGHPVMVERAMYAHDGSGRWGTAGHRAAGVPQPAAVWHLAEGHVGGIFDTYLLVANPNAEPAEVTVEATGEYGVVHTGTHTVAPGSRLTLFAGDMPVPVGATAFTVRTDTETPVVVERAMWWREAPHGAWVESHASSGETTPGRRWGVTDVRLGGPRNESQYLLVKNVAHTPTALDVTLTLDDGSIVTRSVVVAADARLTVDLRYSFPEAVGRVASAVAEASGDVVVEVSRYWDAAGARWGAGTNVKATRLDIDQ